ncbi:uncharacterized protein EI90DRAFT_966904 [Cantharellus anzutake]|uniref:uncharacterized protein n=1 Tax=Cantharellus anzutake TaxID=1750568 RepID=UPI0019059218|nr:uncharacterized protein EI90DRAFT_966904 [Cantharellus anzutake]KAF8311525.1 hypothetical protein EI90DRAFT_966904 [Cantharellus anzutake]
MEELSNTQRLLSDGPGSSANSKLSLSPSTPTKRGKVVRGRENVSPTPSPASPPRSLYRSPLAGSVKARGPPRDAFQMLLAPKPRTVPAVSKEEIDRFYEGEAEESDDEAPFGLPVTTQDEDDDEADGEEVVKELVDDREMNEETEARQLVYEKHQELEKVDDEKNLKIAQNAVDGKFRAGTKRRRRGIDGAGSDSDGSDDEVVRRAKPPKRRNIAGDTLPDLGDPRIQPRFHSFRHIKVVSWLMIMTSCHWPRRNLKKANQRTTMSKIRNNISGLRSFRGKSERKSGLRNPTLSRTLTISPGLLSGKIRRYSMLTTL